MSTDFSIRPVGTPAATPVVHASSEAAASAVSTELPASQSVAASAASVAVRNDLQPAGQFVARQAFLDQAAASIVYQVVDTRTNAVVNQYPEEAVLRRRAYFHALDLTKVEPTRLLVTDRKA
jgi:hypothetical protein